MKWLKIEYIKAHARIDFDCEDALLEQYADSAEQTLLTLMRRTYDSLIDEYGEIPARLYELAQLMVTVSYEHRTPISTQNMSLVPYAFDIMLKPFMRLSGGSDIEAERDSLLERLADTASDFEQSVAELDPDTIDEETQADIDEIRADIMAVQAAQTAIRRVTPLTCSRLRLRVKTIAARCDKYINPETPATP